MKKRKSLKRSRSLISAFCALFVLLAVSLPASAAEPVTYDFRTGQTCHSLFTKSGPYGGFGEVTVGTVDSFWYPVSGGSYNYGVAFDRTQKFPGISTPVYDFARDYFFSLGFSFSGSSSFPLLQIRKGMQTHISWKMSIGSNQVNLPAGSSNVSFSLLFNSVSGESFSFPLSDYGSYFKPADYSWHLMWDFDLPSDITGVSEIWIQVSGSQNNTPLVYQVACSVFEMVIRQTSPNEDIIDYIGGSVSQPSNKGEVDETLSDYQQKEDELNSSIDTGGVVSAIGGLNLSGIIDSANVFGDCFDYLWGKLGKLQVVSQFAIVSGTVMMILGLGATVGNVMEYRRAEQIRAQERAARQASQDLDRQQWRSYLMSRHRMQDSERAERSSRLSLKESGGSPSYDLEAFKKLGWDLPDIDDG